LFTSYTIIRCYIFIGYARNINARLGIKYFVLELNILMSPNLECKTQHLANIFLKALYD